MNKKLSLDMLKAHHACSGGCKAFQLVAMKSASIINECDFASGREFEAVELLPLMKQDEAHLLWVTPLICTPAEVIGLAQDIAQIAVDELQILCDKYDTHPTEFDWVRDYVRNPNRRDYRQMWRECSEIELLFDITYDEGAVEQLTTTLNSFAEIVSELQGDQPFEYDEGDFVCYDETCCCRHEQFENFADELRGHTDTIETMIDNVDCFSARTLTKEINAAFITAFTPAHKEAK